jgi:hypothetical protein
VHANGRNPPIHWSYFTMPPVGLPDAWVELFHALAGPANVAAIFFLCPGAHLQPLEGLSDLCDCMADAWSATERELMLCRGLAPKTWRVGHHIRNAVGPKYEAMLLMLSGLPPRRLGERPSEGQIAAAQRELASVSRTELETLLEELAQAIEADFAAECVRLKTGGAGQPAQTTTLDVRRPIEFRPGGFRLHGGDWQSLTGKAWLVLNAISEAPDCTRNSEWLFAEFWTASPSSPDVVKDAVSDARIALRTALGKLGKDQSCDPLPVADRGKLRAWRLDLPPL